MSTVYEQQIYRNQLEEGIKKSIEKLNLLARQKEAFLTEGEELERAKEAKHAALDAKRLGDIESKIKTVEKSIFDDYQSNYKKRKEME